jgi:hypothetical protein
MKCQLIEELTSLISYMGHVVDLRISSVEAAILLLEVDTNLQGSRGELDAAIARTEKMENAVEQLSELGS